MQDPESSHAGAMQPGPGHLVRRCDSRGQADLAEQPERAKQALLRRL